MKQVIFILFGFLLVVSCNTESKQSPTEEKSTTAKQDSFTGKFDYHFDSFQIINDTLKLISQNHYFYECFGKFSNPDKLINHFKENLDVKKESEEDILYRVKSGKSFIKYFFNEEDKIMDLVSGKITSSDFEMTNGIRVGLSKKEVERILFDDNRHNFDNVNTVQIITAVLGVWIDLKFNDEKLVEVKINTDYQVNKD